MLQERSACGRSFRRWRRARHTRRRDWKSNSLGNHVIASPLQDSRSQAWRSEVKTLLIPRMGILVPLGELTHATLKLILKSISKARHAHNRICDFVLHYNGYCKTIEERGTSAPVRGGSYVEGVIGQPIMVIRLLVQSQTRISRRSCMPTLHHYFRLENFR